MKQTKSKEADLLIIVFILLLVIIGLFSFLLFFGGFNFLSEQLSTTQNQTLKPTSLPENKQAVAPKHVLLNVPQMQQLPELPNGCEATSLASVLTFLGYSPNKTNLATNYIPNMQLQKIGNVQYGPNPEDAYPGEPGTETLGFYCYPPVLQKAANDYLAQHGGNHIATDFSKAGAAQLKQKLDEDIPVIVWGTTDLNAPKESEFNNWYFYDTQTLFTPFSNIHVFVLIGYDADNFYFMDPLEKNTMLRQSVFIENYTATGMRAVVVS